MRLAPNYLQQNVNRSFFSLMNFTKKIRGIPAIENKIITEVAGYGSQIGTIIDFLKVLESKCNFLNKSTDPKDIYKLYKFKDLADKIDKVKEEV